MHTASTFCTDCLLAVALLPFAVGICSPEYLWDVVASQCATVVDDKHGLSQGKRRSSHLHLFSLEKSSDLTSDLPLMADQSLNQSLSIDKFGASGQFLESTLIPAEFS